MKSSRGFTIIELLVTMMVLGIIALMAAPSFNGVMRSISTDSNVSKIRGALTFAKAEASARQGFITVCPSDDGLTCDNTLDWSNGWLVFSDEVMDGLGDPGSFEDDGDGDLCEEGLDDCVLRVWEDGLTQDGTLTQMNAAALSMTFDDEGFTANNLAEIPDFQLRMNDCGVGERRDITINIVGRIVVTPGDC